MTKRSIRACLIAVCGLAVASPALGWHHHDDDDDEIPYSEAQIFFELNDTDGDLGIHALIDGPAWKYLAIEDPNERRMLNIFVSGRLKRQGLTEIFFESAEPNFDDLPPEQFFRRFPAGTYEIEGRTLDGQELESEAEITHVIPAPAPNFTINGEPARPDDDECEEDELPELTLPVVVEWDEVTESHPDLGVEDENIEIIRYQVVSELEDEDENVFGFSVDIVPDEDTTHYSVTISPEFFVDESEVKFEILVRESSYNQTATESCPFEFVSED